MPHGPEQRTHTAAIGLTFEEWNTWHGTARSAGYENTSDWVRAADPKRELARELANIGAQLGTLTDELSAEPGQGSQQAALAGAVIDRW